MFHKRKRPASKMTSKVSVVFMNLTICGSPVGYCSSLEPYRLLIQTVTHCLDSFLNNDYFFENKQLISSVKQIIFIPFSVVSTEKMGLENNSIYLSFNQCSYYFDFLEQICTMSHLIKKGNISKRDYSIFDDTHYSTYYRILPFIKNEPELTSYDIVKATDGVYEDLIKNRRQSFMDRTAVSFSLLFLVYKNFEIDSLKISILRCTIPRYAQYFEQQFIKVYTELSHESFFIKYKDIIENHFSKVICCDIFGDKLPFVPRQRKSLVILSFRKKYLINPYLMISDLIFFAGVAKQKHNLDKGYEEGDVLRNQFLADLSNSYGSNSQLESKESKVRGNINRKIKQERQTFKNSLSKASIKNKYRKRPPRDLKVRNRLGGWGFLDGGKR